MNFSVVKKTILENKEILQRAMALELHRDQKDLDLEWDALESYLLGFESRDVNLAGIPRGLMVAIGSYVWPVFYSVQVILAALAAGNSLILKPSERAQKSVGVLLDFLKKAEPMFQSVELVLGDQEAGRQLVLRPDVKTVIFQGSYEAGLRVTQDALAQPWKQVLLFMGAKNPAIIVDQTLEKIPSSLIDDCFLGSGQNCLSTSIVFVPEARAEILLKDLAAQAKNFKLSPMIDPSMAERYLKMIAVAGREGARMVLKGGISPLSPTIVYFETMTATALKRSTVLNFEVMAPMVSVAPFRDEKHLDELLGALSFCHTATFFGDKAPAGDQFSQKLEFGRVLWNQSALKLDAWKSFNAKKRSGNHAVWGAGLINLLRTY